MTEVVINFKNSKVQATRQDLIIWLVERLIIKYNDPLHTLMVTETYKCKENLINVRGRRLLCSSYFLINKKHPIKIIKGLLFFSFCNIC